MCKIGEQEHGPELEHVFDFTAQYYHPDTGAVTQVQVVGYHKTAVMGRLANISHMYYANPQPGQRALVNADKGATTLAAARASRKAAWVAADTATDPAKPRTI